MKWRMRKVLVSDSSIMNGWLAYHRQTSQRPSVIFCLDSGELFAQGRDDFWMVVPDVLCFGRVAFEIVELTGWAADFCGIKFSWERETS
jgi:hypothetical protein